MTIDPLIATTMLLVLLVYGRMVQGGLQEFDFQIGIGYKVVKKFHWSGHFILVGRNPDGQKSKGQKSKGEKSKVQKSEVQKSKGQKPEGQKSR